MIQDVSIGEETRGAHEAEKAFQAKKEVLASSKGTLRWDSSMHCKGTVVEKIDIPVMTSHM